MLPFLDKAKMAGLVMQRIGKGNVEVSTEEVEQGGDESSYALKMCMIEFMHAFERKEPVAMGKAFKDAFELLEMLPHDEVEHEEE